MRPCSFRTSSGVTASARSIISFTAASCSSISARSPVAQRVHVQHERLLDLRVVEEVAAALRSDPRMVREHDRRAEHHVVVRRREHGPGVDAVAGRIQLRDKARASRNTKDRVSRDERVAKRLPAREARPEPSVRFSTRNETRRKSEPPRLKGSDPFSRWTQGWLVPRRRPARSRPRPRSAAARPRGARRSAAGSAPRRVISPSPSTMHWSSRWSWVVSSVAGVRGRVDDPERGRGRVLGRSRRVRVERVALVEQRVDQLVDAHRASSSSSATQASSVGSARAAFSRWSARSVSSRSAIQPVRG